MIKNSPQGVFNYDQTELWPRIDLDAYIGIEKNGITEDAGEKDLVLFISYGSMLLPTSTFMERTGFTLRRKGLIGVNGAEDIWNLHVGIYRIEKKLVFNKMANAGNFGYANLIGSDNNDYTIASVYAIPKSLLYTGGTLMQAEGCVNYDYYDPKNQYILMPNVFELTNVDNGHRIKAFSAYVFMASNKFIDNKLVPHPEYAKGIIDSLEQLQLLGFNITEPYVEQIRMKL